MKIINVAKFFGNSIYQWDESHLFKILTEGKHALLKDGPVVAAFRRIDRKDFVPDEYKERAYEDADINIGYTETLTRPTIIAQMITALKPHYGGKYLDIGSGSGYAAMILGFIAGEEGKVISIERVQWLWDTAIKNAKKYTDVRNVRFVYADGMKGIPTMAPFDGIHVSFAMDNISEELKMQLNQDGGRLVCPTTTNDIRIIERNGNNFSEEIVPGYVWKEGKSGTV